MLMLCGVFGVAMLLLYAAGEVRKGYPETGTSIRTCGNLAADPAACRVLVAVAWLLLTLVVGLRSWDVGTDSLMYARQFVPDFSTSRVYTSPGYTLVCLVFSAISHDLWPLLFLLMAGATFWFLMRFVWEQSPVPWLSFFILLCFGFLLETVNQYRQMFAVVVVLYALRYLDGRGTRRFVALVIVAASVHLTALLALSFPLLKELRLSSRLMFFSLPVAFLACLVLVPLLRGALSHVPYFGYYVGSSHDEGLELSSLAVLLFRIGLFVAVVLLGRKASERDEGVPSIGGLIGILYGGLLVQCCAASFHLAARLATYFVAVFALVIPRILVCVAERRARVGLLALVLVVFSLLFAGTLSLKDYSDYSYSFVWQRTTDVSLVLRPTP